ncbi:hypothetical protein D9757_014625 [Collybiopsis confluens]|uniref:Uncharacterized protein n=1 Tax=Collybiopsis confluens TaxID=2823264 RepID=A0A8H5CGJ5_9AGAR|nr:hypothetical protein D9757_014625 [Collybiopsis confluens]
MAVAGAGVLWTSISLSFILTGTWINLLLYAFELLIGLHYLVRVRGWAKALLGATLLLDTVSTIFVCQIAWVVRDNTL